MELIKSNSETLCDGLTINTISVMVTVSFFRAPDDDIDVFVGFLCVLGFIIRKYFWMLRSERSRFMGLTIYTNTVVLVVTAYALLLANSFQYIILAPFPISLAGFIVYLYKERLEHNGSGAEVNKDRKKSDKHRGATTHQTSTPKDDEDLDKDSKKAGELEMVVIPYCMLLISAIVIPYKNSPVLSHFLLFSCCALGTLALLYSRLAEATPALKPALECIQMAYIMMLFITVHTVAAEWLGEITALVTMPELIAGLVWFYTTLLHSDTSSSTNRAGLVHKVKSDKDNRIGSSSSSDASSETKQVSASIFIKGFIFDGSMFIPLGAVLAGLITSTYAYDGELMATWNTKATVACSIAGCLPYLSIWTVSRWPGRIPSSDKATQLLKFAANMCLTGACLMLFALLAEKTLAYRLFGLDEILDPSLLRHLPAVYFSTAVALCFFGKHLAGALADLGDGLGGLQSSPAARASMEMKGRRRRKKKKI